MFSLKRLLLPQLPTAGRYGEFRLSGLAPFRWSIFMALLAVRVVSAEDSPRPGDTAREDAASYFQEYVEPLLQEHCFDCHSHDAGEASGGLVLDSKAGWSVGGDSGPAIVPGNLPQSLLWRVVNHFDAGLEMPPDGKLSDDQLLILKAWIETGAVDPRVDGQAAAKSEIDIEAGKQWWSFRPLRSQEPPDSPGASATRIDRFIDAKLDSAGLPPAPAASRTSLLRRLSYDLTGLPPDLQWVAKREPLSDAEYILYVDKLLADEGFGEKWGRHWLDVARYADSNGSSFNVPFHNAWRYRNWVIEATNRNLPIDVFIQKQLAGDLLPASSIAERDENLIATGYLLLGSKVLGTFDKQQLTLDVIDEQVDTIGKSLLGMTLGCARCHDHKFDPLPQADYYALAGILHSTSTLVDRIGGPKDDESDWERRGLGPGGDDQLSKFLESNRYAWVRAVGKRFTARKELDELDQKLSTVSYAADPVSIPGRSSNSEALLELQRLHEDAAKQLRKAEEKLQDLLVEMPPHAMAVRDTEVISDLEIRIRGVASSKGKLVPRGFLRVASYPDQPEVPEAQSGRLQLAQWITSPHNPLTARVFVNRVWKHLFQVGIARSVDNFGTTGELPTHPQLLDDLAFRFIDNGWDLKRLVREIVLSQAYRRAVGISASGDLGNRLLAHQHRRRLEAEEIRDTLLQLSGRLIRGPNEHVLRTLPIGDASNLGEYLKLQDNRRTVYQPVIRTLEPNVLQLFDAASNTMVTGDRPRTIVAPQSLYFLNSSFVQESAEAIGSKLLERFVPDGRPSLAREEYLRVLDSLLDDLMLMIVARLPTPDERRVLSQYIEDQADGLEGLTRHDMLKVCQAIIGSTQFQFLD
ncbi:PSD1 and planctomycete cytochrome C domain-containing protein [Planctomycetaceae bacterium SH139]